MPMGTQGGWQSAESRPPRDAGTPTGSTPGKGERVKPGIHSPISGGTNNVR
jgi:hypothetical protein